MNSDPEYAGAEPVHTSSQTAHALSELQLYGWRPFQDEPDPRPLPEGNTVAAAVTDIFDALVATLGSPIVVAEVGEVQLGVSIGVAVAPDHGDTPQQLLQAADAAMYRAKRAGGGRYLLVDATPTAPDGERIRR